MCNSGENLEKNSNDTLKNVCPKSKSKLEKQPEMAQSLVKSQFHNNEIISKAPRKEVACSAGNSDVPGKSVPKNGSFVKVFDVKESMSLYDKYALDLHLKDKNRDVLAVAKGNKNYDAWDAQVVGKFGYIPLSNHKIPDYDKNVVFDGDPIATHEKVWNSKEFNFMGEQILVPSHFNIDVWNKELQGYWDKQLLFLLKYGFPLDFDYTNPLKSTLVNHSSAMQHIDDVKYYVQTERKYGALLGPFVNPPINNLHVSPFLSRPKPDSAKHRIILDLSFPKAFAVNSYIPKDVYLETPFVLKLPTVDDIVKKIIQFGKGSHIFKIDIGRAFRHVKIDPRDY